MSYGNIFGIFNIFGGIFGAIGAYITDIFNLLENSPTYTGGALTVTDYEGTLVTSPAGTAGFEGGRLATTVAEGAKLGPESVVNGGFSNWTGDNPDGWSVGESGSNVVTEHADGAEFIYVDAVIYAQQSDPHYTAVQQQVTIEFGDITGFIKLYDGTTLIRNYGSGASNTTSVVEFEASSNKIKLLKNDAGSAVVKSISIKEVIPTWYDTDLSGNPLQTSVSLPTKAGTRKWYTEPFSGGFGYSNWPARTNLFLNSNAPVTQNITTTAQAYTISVLGTGDVTVSGTASGTATAGSPLTVTATAGTMTCTVTGTLSRVQVEAGAFASPWIETTTATVTRAATNLSLSTEGVLPVNDFGIWGEVIPGASGQGLPSTPLVSTYISADNHTEVIAYNGNTLYFKKRYSATDYNAGPVNYVHTKDTPFQYQVFQSATYGMGIRVKEQGGVWSVWTLKDDADGRLDAPVAATYSVGNRNNANHFAGYYPNTAIIQHDDPKAELERLATEYGGA
jgi:hypothetical protein